VTAQVSDRAQAAYISFSNDFPHAISGVRSLLKDPSKSDPIFSHPVTLQQISMTLRLPIARLGVYAIELSIMYEDVDVGAKKKLMAAMKLLRKLSRKCHAIIFPKI
jgi:hypothetical protein